MAVLAMRAQGMAAKAIAEQLGYSEDTLRQYVSRANRKGWIDISAFDNVDDQLEHVIKAKVVKNVNAFLDREDKDVTLEAAKGLGMFKTHQVVKGDQVAQVGFALRVQVEMPPNPSGNKPVVSIRPGTIAGSTALDVPNDAEVIDATVEE